MSKEELVRRFWERFESEIAEQGYELVEVEIAGQSGMRILRLYIDKPEVGIRIEDCSIVSQFLNPLLDAEDFISENYILEVSSPGIDRPLRKPADFIRFAGEEIVVQTYSPLQGRKKFTGILRGCEDGLIQVDCDESPVEIHLENLKRANLNR